MTAPVPSHLDLIAACTALASTAAMAEIVAEPELAAFCIGEVAAELGTCSGNILTLPVKRSGGRYIVFGQSPSRKHSRLFWRAAAKPRSRLAMRSNEREQFRSHSTGRWPAERDQRCFGQRLG